MTDTLTIAQRLLLAASTLPVEFDEDDLTVACWERWPAVFGLAKYPGKSADNNKLRTYLVGERGLVAKGFLFKVGPKRYALLGAAWTEVAGINAGAAPPRMPDATAVSWGVRQGILRLLDTEAYRLTVTGQADRITPAMARAFLDRFEADAVAEFGRVVAGRVVQWGNRVMNEREHRALVACEAALRKRFGRQLETGVGRG